MPFWEKYNQIQTWVPEAESALYPGALPGLLVAGDPGIPKTLSPTQYDNFAPRVGLAYAPRFDQGPLRTVFGSSGQSSIRASYGVFYTAFPGLSAGIMYSVPPFGFNYLSPGPPLMATPFITAATGVNNGQRFPFPFPPHNVSASHPDTSVNWANFAPLAADPFFYYRNRVPYINSYIFSASLGVVLSARIQTTPRQPVKQSTEPAPDKTADHASGKEKTTARTQRISRWLTRTITRSKLPFVISVAARNSCSAIPMQSRSIKAPTLESSLIPSTPDKAVLSRRGI